jgi:predicted anti-sigma-YlaC factor YlaD
MSISCEIISDLMPLVKDKVASEDSIMLVSEHLKSCEKCKLEFESNAQANIPAVDDRRVVMAIKKRMMFGASALLLLGGSIGMALSNSALSSIVAVLIAVLSIVIVGVMIFKYDNKGDRRMSRFFMRKAIGTIILFIILGIYLLLKYILQLF